MFKVWVKIENKHKIIKSKIFKSDSQLSQFSFEEIIKKACEEWDIACPVVLSYHYANFCEFNQAIFKPSDFVEYFGYEKLIFENIGE